MPIILLDRFGNRLVMINEVKAVDDTAMSHAPYTSYEYIGVLRRWTLALQVHFVQHEKRIEICVRVSGSYSSDEENANTSVFKRIDPLSKRPRISVTPQSAGLTVR